MEIEHSQKSSNKWRLSFFATLVLFVVVTLFLVYSIVDLGVANHYMKIGYEDLETDNTKLRYLVTDLSKTYTKKDILVLLRQRSKEEIIAETDSTIDIGGLTFVFDNGGHLLNILQQ